MSVISPLRGGSEDSFKRLAFRRGLSQRSMVIFVLLNKRFSYAQFFFAVLWRLAFSKYLSQVIKTFTAFSGGFRAARGTACRCV